MYDILLKIHSVIPYLFLATSLAVLALCVAAFSTKRFVSIHKMLATITMILAHIQLLFGLFLLFFGDYARAAWAQGMGVVMKNPEMRLSLVEHPLMMIIAVTLLTIGHSRSKTKTTDVAKNRTIFIFYSIALVLVLARLPYAAWFN